MEARKGMYINIIITQAVCAVLILAGILVMKYFYKAEFEKFKNWYTVNITADTDIKEVTE